MYKSAADALESLIKSETQRAGSQCRITKLPSKVSIMTNGIEYCFVEVTCSIGGQYGIEAFGQEAQELHAVASSITERQELMAAVPLMVAGAGGQI